MKIVDQDKIRRSNTCAHQARYKQYAGTMNIVLKNPISRLSKYFKNLKLGCTVRRTEKQVFYDPQLEGSFLFYDRI